MTKPRSFDSGFPRWRVRAGASLAQDDSFVKTQLPDRRPANRREPVFGFREGFIREIRVIRGEYFSIASRRKTIVTTEPLTRSSLLAARFG